MLCVGFVLGTSAHYIAEQIIGNYQWHTTKSGGTSQQIMSGLYGYFTCSIGLRVVVGTGLGVGPILNVNHRMVLIND